MTCRTRVIVDVYRQPIKWNIAPAGSGTFRSRCEGERWRVQALGGPRDARCASLGSSPATEIPTDSHHGFSAGSAGLAAGTATRSRRTTNLGRSFRADDAALTRSRCRTSASKTALAQADRELRDYVWWSAQDTADQLAEALRQLCAGNSARSTCRQTRTWNGHAASWAIQPQRSHADYLDHPAQLIPPSAVLSTRHRRNPRSPGPNHRAATLKGGHP